MLTAGTLALAACEEQPTIVRGFDSRQLLHLRDASFSFYASKQDQVYFVTDTGGVGGGAMNYRSVDLATGAVTEFGATKPTLSPPPPPERYSCKYDTLADGSTRALTITDTQSNVATVIEGISYARPYCPPDNDPTIHAWLRGSDDILTLWRGPYTDLEQAPLSLIVRAAAPYEGGMALVQAAWPTEPAALGLHLLDETTLASSEILAPALTSAAWAEGATPSGSLVSPSTARPLSLQWAGVSRFAYTRTMSDGGTTMFVGPRVTDAANELALFRVDGTQYASPTIEPYNFRYDGLWPHRLAWLFGDPGPQEVLVWHEAQSMITSCPWIAGSPYGFADPAGKNIAFRKLIETTSSTGGPLLVVAPSAGAAAACRTLADRDVIAVDFSPDGSAMFWLVQPRTGDLDASLWTAAADGSGARLLGSGIIDGPPYDAAPHFVGPSQLELKLGGDLVWVDVHDDPVRVHYVADHVFGGVIDLGRWLVTGHDYSDQDDAGGLALINRDSGETRPISPAVAAYMSPDVSPIPWLRDMPDTIRIVYLVRGRNPSSHDGLWLASIPAPELQ